MSKKVFIESDLKELIPTFLENRHSDILNIVNALESQDLISIARLGHTFKGVGGGYGFDFISELGKKMEEAAKAENYELIRQLVAELETYLETIEIEYI